MAINVSSVFVVVEITPIESPKASTERHSLNWIPTSVKRKTQGIEGPLGSVEKALRIKLFDSIHNGILVSANMLRM